MPDLREQLNAALGRVEPTFAIDDLRDRAAKRRRHRLITHTVIAVLVPTLVLGGILTLSSGGNERSVATATAPTGVFPTKTGTVLAFGDGLDGLLLVDLDHNRAVRKPLGGSDPNELFGPTLTGNAFVMSADGVINAVPLDGGAPRPLGPAVQAVKAAQPGAVWLFSWPGGRIGAGTPSYKLVDVSGKVLQAPSNDSPDLAAGAAVPDTAYRDGIVYESVTGVRTWNTTTNTVKFLSRGEGIVGDTHDNTITWCDNECAAIHIADGVRDLKVSTPRAFPSFDVRGGRFSPDGTKMAVLAGPLGPLSNDSRAVIVLIDVKHGTQKVVVRNVPAFDSIAWSADGTQLFFADDSYKKPVTDIGRLDLASGVVQRATVPFGDGLRFVALTQGEAREFLKVRTGPPSECPSVATTDLMTPPNVLLVKRASPCAFNFTARRTRPGGVKLTPCPVTKTVSLGSDEGNTFGRKSADGTLSIIVPPDGSYSAPRDPKGGYDLKVPFYRVHAGHLAVVATRLDGPGRGTVETHESSYAPTGFLPTGPYLSDLGCWRITGTQGSQHVSAVIRVTQNRNGPAG